MQDSMKNPFQEVSLPSFLAELKSTIVRFFEKQESVFIDLGPVDNATNNDQYEEALDYAIRDDRIANIALTGPYASGKSSIIATFEKKNRKYKFLNVSLASFSEEIDSPNGEAPTQYIDCAPPDDPVHRRIEKSILQQMLYGADAGKLPYSRFRRITLPRHSFLKAAIALGWGVTIAALVATKDTGLWVTLPAWAWAASASIVLGVPVVILADLHKGLFGISIKSLSLKNGEIETGEIQAESIFNRNLDEILYFFQATNYHAVVIEDLDRFGRPEIFVKLREINKLVNDNIGGRKKLKFIYAIKDDMFDNKNRTKFFDFIIPVVPIVNASNSLDKMLERIRKLPGPPEFDDQFIRDVSLYINDLRLINNIFNEFYLYESGLRSPHLNPTKLLAIIIYKNLYPSDFEKVHDGIGSLCEICNLKNEYLSRSRESLRSALHEQRKLLKLSNEESSKNLEGLLASYIGMIIRYSNLPIAGVRMGNKVIKVAELYSLDMFMSLTKETNIHLSCQQGHSIRNVSINKSFEQIEKEVDPGSTFVERVERVENRSVERRNAINQEIRQLESALDKLVFRKLVDLAKDDPSDINEVCERNGLEKPELFIYLIRTGHLNEDYNGYISVFHEGRLTSEDRNYLLSIRNDEPPNPDRAIRTPREVVASMRSEDFEQLYALNVHLVDYLLENSDSHSQQLSAAIRCISRDLLRAEPFLKSYYSRGKKPKKLIQALCMNWVEFPSFAAKSNNAAEHVSYIIRFAEAGEEFFESNPSGGDLANYLAENGDQVFASDVVAPKEYEILNRLDVFFEGLDSMHTNADLISFSIQNCRYRITPDNVFCVIKFLEEKKERIATDPSRANLTAILELENQHLTDYLEKNISDYVDNVFLILPENTEEDVEVIKRLTNDSNLDVEQKIAIIEKQEFLADTFEGFPEGLWVNLLVAEKVSVSWSNVCSCLAMDRAAEINEFMSRPEILEDLPKEKIVIDLLGKDKALTLSRFIIGNQDLEDAVYQTYITCIPYVYNSLPDGLSTEKYVLAINARKVALNTTTYSETHATPKLLAPLIGNNIDCYFEAPDDYPIDNEVRALLLLEGIADSSKVKICKGIEVDGSDSSKELYSLACSLLADQEADCSGFQKQLLLLFMENGNTVNDSVSLLIRCLTMLEESEAMSVLEKLPEPYSEIASYGKRPRLPVTAMDRHLANALCDQGFISTSKEADDHIRINTKKSSAPEE